MTAMSDWLEGQIRAHIFRTATYTKPTVAAVSLCSASPTDAGTGASQNELTSTGSYNRTSNNPLDANWTAASSTDALTDNAAAITFPTATGNWSSTVTHCAINDSATIGAGNMAFWGALTVSKTVNNGDVFKFNTGDLDVTIDN